MAIHATFGGMPGVGLTQVSTTKVFALGDRVCASNGSVYEYMRADEALDQYAAVKIDDDGEASELTTAISGSEPTRVAITQVAFADTEYGWAVVHGSGTVLCISGGGAAANVKMYTTTTAGTLDDVATDLVQGLKLNTAESSGTAPFYTSTFMATNSQD